MLPDFLHAGAFIRLFFLYIFKFPKADFNGLKNGFV